MAVITGIHHLEAPSLPEGKRQRTDTVLNFNLPVDLFQKIISLLPDQGLVLRSSCEAFRKRVTVPPDMYRNICQVAARQGWINVLKWVHAKGYEWDQKTCAAAAEGGHLDVLQWLRQQGCEWHSDTCEAAASEGHFKVLQWAVENGCPLSAGTSQNAAGLARSLILIHRNHANLTPSVESVCWLHSHEKSIKTPLLIECENAARQGSDALLDWAMAKNSDHQLGVCALAAQWDDYALYEWAKERDLTVVNRKLMVWFAAEFGHLTFLKKIYDKNHPLCTHVLENVAQSGHLHVLKWLEEQNCFSGTIASAAVRGGHFDILLWAYSKGCVLDEPTANIAAEGGHLKILMWLWNMGCKPEPSISTRVALFGHLTTLQFLMEKGYAVIGKTLDNAAEGGHMPVVRWLLKIGCPVSTETICLHAARSGNFTLFKWLVAKSFPFDDAICSPAARGGSLAMLKWLKKNGYAITAETRSSAENMGHQHICDWIDQEGQRAAVS